MATYAIAARLIPAGPGGDAGPAGLAGATDATIRGALAAGLRDAAAPLNRNREREAWGLTGLGPLSIDRTAASVALDFPVRVELIAGGGGYTEAEVVATLTRATQARLAALVPAGTAFVQVVPRGGSTPPPPTPTPGVFTTPEFQIVGTRPRTPARPAATTPVRAPATDAAGAGVGTLVFVGLAVAAIGYGVYRYTRRRAPR